MCEPDNVELMKSNGLIADRMYEIFNMFTALEIDFNQKVGNNGIMYWTYCLGSSIAFLVAELAGLGPGPAQPALQLRIFLIKLVKLKISISGS